MKNIYALATILLLSLPCFSQTPYFTWVKAIGDTLFDEGKQVTTDLQGNVYVTGYFKGVVDFDPGNAVFNLSSTSDISLFLTKFNAQGDFLFAKQFTGLTQSEGDALQIDASGNIYLGGAFSNQTDLDPGPNTYYLTAQSTDAFICKLNASGDFVWAKQFGGAYGEFAYDLRVANDSHIYFTGEFYDVADFDPGAGVYNLNAPNTAGIYVCKLNADGSLVWAKQVYGGMFNRGYALDLDQNQNVYYAGYFTGTADFDPGSGTQNITANGSQDIFIAKLDSAGNYVWAKNIGGTYIDVAYDLVCDNAGNTYFTGTYASVVDFNPGSGVNNLISGTNSSAYVCKLDANGNYLWAKSFYGSGSSCIGWGIDIDASNNVYTTGFFYGSIDFDPGSSNVTYGAYGTETDNFISKLDANGNYSWALQLAGGGGATGRCVHAASDGSIYVTGYFSQSVDFDPSSSTQVLTGNTNHDMYVLKLGSSTPTGLTTNNTRPDSIVYPNPTTNGNVYWRCEHQVTRVSLFALDGTLLRRVENPSTSEINVIGIASGLYLLQLQQASGTIQIPIQINP